MNLVKQMAFSAASLVGVGIIGIVGVGAGFSGAVRAEPETASPHSWTGNVGLFSQYIFRGLSQTDEKPALQGGFDYAHAQGFYAGVWGSNVSWISDFVPDASASLELDLYGGYKWTQGDFGVDVGLLRYQYPGSYPKGMVKPHTTELYMAGSWKTVSLKYSHSLSDTFGICDTDGSYYLDLTASWPVTETITLLGHAGRQKYKGSCQGGVNDLASYTDWKLEASWAFAKDWALGLGYTDTNARKEVYTPAKTDRFIGDGYGYLYVKKSF